MASRRFVQFSCTGRGTHKVRRLRRFRWEPIVETIAAGPGAIYASGDIEAWQEDLRHWNDLLASGVNAHLVEGSDVRDVDGVPVSRMGDLSEYAVMTTNEASHNDTRAIRCPTCARNLPLRHDNLAELVRLCMENQKWEFDISRGG